MTQRAILYLRLSAVVDDSTSIVRQETDLREHAAREGWDVVRVLVDDGISGRKARENAAEALRMLREGEAEVLAVWKLDRWTRQGLSAVGDLVSTLEAAPGTLFFALRDGLRSDQAAFGIIAAVLAETAKAEADNAAVRISSSITYRKLNGRWTGGTPPFGYRPAPAPEGPGKILVPNPVEREIVRELADEVLAGVSVYQLGRRLRDRGVPSARSPYRIATLRGRDPEGLDRGRWEPTGVRQLLLSHHLLGRVTLNGKAVTGDDGLPMTSWEPLLDLATFSAVGERLRTKKASPLRGGRRRSTSRLLSGLLYCGGCDAPLTVNDRGREGIIYTCKVPLGLCASRVTVTAERVEETVTEAYLSVVGDFEELREEVTAIDDGREADLKEIEAALQETSAALTSDDANVELLLQRLSLLKNRRAEIQALPPVSGEVRLVPTGRSNREAWEALGDDLTRKYNLLRSAIDHITIRPVVAEGRRRFGYSPDRVVIHWRPEHTG